MPLAIPASSIRALQTNGIKRVFGQAGLAGHALDQHLRIRRVMLIYRDLAKLAIHNANPLLMRARFFRTRLQPHGFEPTVNIFVIEWWVG